jgi:predicted RNase H-like HicB family nuclease
MKTNVTMNGISGLFLGLPPEAVMYVAIAFAVIHLLVTFLIASAVKNDAECLSVRNTLFLVSPWMWFVIVMLTAYAGALAYWLIHYSALRYRTGEKEGWLKNPLVGTLVPNQGFSMKVEVEKEEDGRWIAEVPALWGAMAYGTTKNEAVAKVEALVLRALADKIEHGEEAPELTNNR